MATLNTQIKNLRVKGQNGWFIPQKPLYELLTAEAIQDELERVEYPFLDPLEDADIILSKGRKVFAILVETECHPGIVEKLSFVGLLDDSRLPFTDFEFKTVQDQDFEMKFRRFQADYTAPIWGDRSKGHKILPDDAVLPFVEQTPLSEGGYGKTYVVKLHSGHQALFDPEDEKLELVCKELKSEYDTPSETTRKFEHETKILKSLKYANNRRIIPILGSYEFKGTYNLLFPRAEADAGELLKGKPLSFSIQGVDKLIGECRGLAYALRDIHNLKINTSVIQQDLVGLHHDIKPNNILILNGMLVLADFGLSRLVKPTDGSVTGYKQGHGDYLAPECLGDKLASLQISRASDVWSLGCFMAELTTFVQMGPDGVKEFREKRRSKSVPNYSESWFHSLDKVKEQVEAWLSGLEKDASVQGLVSLIRRMLSLKPEERPGIAEVGRHLAWLELRALISRVSRALSRLLKKIPDWNLGTEEKRFREWNRLLMGSVNLSDGGTDDLMVQLEKKLPAFRETMLQLCDQVEKFGGNENLMDDLHHSVRGQVDVLWQDLPGPLKELFRTRFRESALKLAAQEHLPKLDEVTKDPDPAVLARTKRLSLKMQEGQGSRQKPLITKDQISYISRIGNNLLGHYRPGPHFENVLIERWDIERWPEDATDELFDRMAKVSTFPNIDGGIPAELRILTSKGYFYHEEDDCFGVVYNMPPEFSGGAGPWPPITLRFAIDRTQSVRHGLKPPLGDRMALALRLCRCMAKLHSIGWLHRNFCLENVLVFSFYPITVVAPYVVGFNHSLQENEQADISPFCTAENTTTSLPYQHPAYSASLADQRLKFNRACDYYSLGVVLLEIGMWTAIADHASKMAGLFSNQEETRQNAALELARGLGASMGNLYRDAVLFCLEIEYDSVDSTEGFQHSVIDTLASCRV